MFAAKMPARWFSPEEYLEREETSTERHEYFNGEIFAMAGGSHNHEMVCVNIVAELRHHARRHRCTAYGSNMKIQVKTNGLFTTIYGR